MIKYNNFIIFILLFYFYSFCQTEISGEIYGDIGPGNYIVNGTIVLMPGNTLRIKAGTKIFFREFADFDVMGKLICEGKKDSEVVFESVNVFYNKKPDYFDWNGIRCSEKAEFVFMKYCKIAHSVFGLKVESKNTNIVLERVVFIDNGSSNFSYGGKQYFIQNERPVWINCSKELGECSINLFGVDFNKTDSEAEKKQPQKTKKEKSKKLVEQVEQKDNSKREEKKSTESEKKISIQFKPIGFASFGIVTLTGAGLWIGGHLKAEEYNKKYLEATTRATVEYYKSKRSNAEIVRNIGITCTAIGALGIGVTIFIK